MDKVEAQNGTPVSAEAVAAAMSPCPSCVQIPFTPMGAINTGLGSFSPNNSIDRSRLEQSTIMRGTIPQWWKAAAF